MTPSSLAAVDVPGSPRIRGLQTPYQPGICNIGSAEIARRRRAGHVGSITTLVALVGLVAMGAPPLTRLVIAIPAAAAASGYLQARLRFCAGFGSRGIFNFDALGHIERVVDPDARMRDRRRSNQIAMASLAVGVVVGGAAALLPL